MLFSVSYLVALFFFLNLLKEKLWDMALDQSAQGTTTLLALVVL